MSPFAQGGVGLAQLLGALLHLLLQLIVGLLQGAFVLLPFDGVDQGVGQQRSAHLPLEEVILRPGAHGPAGQFLVVASGEHHDGHSGGVLVDRGEGLPGLAIRQVQIAEHHVDVALVDARQPRFQAFGVLDVEVRHIPAQPRCLRQYLLDDGRIGWIVLD